MLVRKSILSMAGWAALCAVSPAHADVVDLSTYVNADVSAYTGGSNYPGPGQTSIGGIAFQLSGFGGGTGVIQAPNEGATYAITGLNIANAGTAYTIINSAFGIFGSTIGSVTFVGSLGASVTYDLTEGTNIRDHYFGMYNNVATGLYATAAYDNGAQVEDGPGRDHFDVQAFSLLPLNGQTLTEIDFSGNNSGGGQPFLAALTTEPAVVSSVPEPSTWAMMLVGFLSLGFVGYRQSRLGLVG